MKFTYTVDRNWVEVIGHIWQPGCGLCASSFPLTAHDMENIVRASPHGEPTRENVRAWLDTHAGDFQSIADFHAVVGEVEIPWKDEESEFAFNDRMFPVED